MLFNILPNTRKTALGFILPVLIFALAGCGQSATATPDTIPATYAGRQNPLGADVATPGAQTYATYCLPCHGAQGHGDGPAGAGIVPKPADLPIIAAGVGDDHLFWRISEGKPGTSMVGWKGTLQEDQIWQLVSFIRSLK